MCEICNKGMKVFNTINNIGFCIRENNLVLFTKEQDRYKVSFKFNNTTHIGITKIVDYGTFEFPDEIQYDIIVDDKILYKHIKQDDVLDFV